MSLNIVVLTGRLTKEIEMKSTSGGVLVGVFTIAVNDFVNNQEYVNFIDCTTFGKVAERIQQYASKGSLVAIHGSIRQDRWKTKDGDNRSRIGVIVNRVEFMEFKKAKEEPKTEDYTDMDSYADDFPF